MICRFVWRLSILWIIRNACFGLKRQIICCQWVLMGPVVLYCPSQLCNGCRRQLQYLCPCSLCQCSSWHWALEGPQMIAFKRDWVNAITWYCCFLGRKYDIRLCFKKNYFTSIYTYCRSQFWGKQHLQWVLSTMSGWLKQSLLWTAWLCCKIKHKWTLFCCGTYHLLQR